jgi:hypothetical protein
MAELWLWLRLWQFQLSLCRWSEFSSESETVLGKRLAKHLLSAKNGSFTHG